MTTRLFLTAALVLAGTAHANTLDFGQGPGAPSICTSAPSGVGALSTCVDYSYISQGYGDVAGVVDVSYNGQDTPGQSLRWWSTGYNTLYGVLWADGGDSNSKARVALQVLNGGQISLQSLQLGAYYQNTLGTTLTIRDLGSNAVLFSSSQNVGNGSISATPFSFSNLSSTTGLSIEWKNSAYNVGIDNIQYTISAVPEPGTWAMLAAGLLGLGVLARRRRAG